MKEVLDIEFEGLKENGMAGIERRLAEKKACANLKNPVEDIRGLVRVADIIISDAKISAIGTNFIIREPIFFLLKEALSKFEGVK